MSAILSGYASSRREPPVTRVLCCLRSKARSQLTEHKKASGRDRQQIWRETNPIPPAPIGRLAPSRPPIDYARHLGRGAQLTTKTSHVEDSFAWAIDRSVAFFAGAPVDPEYKNREAWKAQQREIGLALLEEIRAARQAAKMRADRAIQKAAARLGRPRSHPKAKAVYNKLAKLVRTREARGQLRYFRSRELVPFVKGYITSKTNFGARKAYAEYYLKILREAGLLVRGPKRGLFWVRVEGVPAPAKAEISYKAKKANDSARMPRKAVLASPGGQNLSSRGMGGAKVSRGTDGRYRTQPGAASPLTQSGKSPGLAPKADIPPAKGVRSPLTAAAGYGVSNEWLGQKPSSTSLVEPFVANEKPLYGPKLGESWQNYLDRVVREQEAKVAAQGGNGRLQDWERRKAQQQAERDEEDRRQARKEAAAREVWQAIERDRVAKMMVEQGKVRLFVDPGRPYGEEWLAAANYRVPGLTAKTVPASLGVGALDYGLDELARAKANRRRVENDAAFVIDLAKRVMRRERWRWATQQEAEKMPHLVVPLSPEGEPMVTAPLTIVRAERTP